MASWEKNSCGIWPTWSENKLFTVLLAIFLVYSTVWVGAQIKKTMHESSRVGYSDLSAPTIVVSATGKASAVPDIATVDMTVSKTETSSAKAQNEASASMKSLQDAMIALGIPEADLKTSSFSLTQVYDYDVSPAVVTGYSSSESLTVKIRNTDLISSVLDAGPKNGATTVSDLRYDIDDMSVVNQAARVDAMAKVQDDAANIAKAMGGRVGRVVSYSENTVGSVPMYYGMMDSATKAADTIAPPVQTGTQDVELTVYVTYSFVQ